MSRIIGIMGKKYSGKDTIGEHLVGNYGYNRIAFADSLKAICRTLFDFTDEQLTTNMKDDIDGRYGRTPREILQFVGTELMRERLGEFVPGVRDSVWTDIVKRQVSESDDRYVVTDVRFENEMNMITELGGIIILVKRENNDSDYHTSEQTIDILESRISADNIVHNNETKDSLFEQIDRIMMKYA